MQSALPLLGLVDTEKLARTACAENKGHETMVRKVHVGGRPAKWALWGAGVFALIGVAGFFIAPPLVKSLAESALSEALHRPVTIEGVSINPYALSAEVRGFRMLEREGGATAVSFASLYANVAAESLLRGGIVVEEVKLVEPTLNVVHLEGPRYNWSDLIDEILNKPDDGSKSHFAIHNIRIEKGRIDFDDRPVGKKHVISDLDLGVPFVSNQPSQVETFVEPLLVMKVNDTPVDIHGKARPFSATRESVVNLKFDGFDLTRYVDYLPGEKTFRLPGARLSSDLEVTFAQPVGKAPDVTAKGSVGLDGVEIQHADGSPAIKLSALRIGIDKLAPFAQELTLGTVTLDKPEIIAVRGRDSQISLRALIPALTRDARAVKQDGVPVDAGDKGKPFAVNLGEFTLSGGRIHLRDDLPTGVYRKELQDLNISLRKLSLPGGAPASLDVDFNTDSGESYAHNGTLAIAPLKLVGTLVARQVDVPALKPYYVGALTQAEVLSGKVDAKLGYEFSLEADDPKVKIKAESLAVSDLGVKLKGESSQLARVGLLEVRDAEVETVSRRVTVGEIIGKATRIALVRDKGGLFNVQRIAARDPGLAGTSAAVARKGVGRAKPAAKAVGPDWQVDVRRIALDDWGVRVEDRTLLPAVVLNAEPLSLKMEGLSTARGSKAKLDLQAVVNKRGKFGIGGTLGLAPLAGSLDVDLKAVDLAMLQPYVTEKVKIAITRGNVTSRGKLAFELPAAGGMKGGFRGNFTVGDFASVDKLNAADFLKWKSLYFGGLDIRLAPLAVSIDEIALTDFYTRLILDAQGGLNIREITAQQAREAKDQQVAAAPENGGKAPPAPPILIKRITLQGGNIAYSDRFIKPNYDANLTGMGGRLTGLSSDPNTIAELDLRGKVDNAAPVEVVGKLNPFRQDKALDITASVKDFELSGVSTYAAKYVGYGIDKGKLSATLAYKIEDRKLTATNQVFLDQLTFGEKVDSPNALKLPVLLAVSLLKNSRGEIDLNLPVGGSLDDPEFSIGGIVFKVIVNLIGKAITSPFALLGSVFGGNSEELAWLEFDAGFSRLAEGAETKLSAIARAMNEKTGLTLDIAGRIDPENDREGLKHAVMLSKVEALKIKDMARKGESLADDGRVRIDAAEYPPLLTRVYRDEKFPKPRNLVGLTKDLPVAEMEKLILANTLVSDDDLRLLAQQRALVVKNWLLDKGHVPAERIFVLASREGADGKETRAKTSRVDFSLR